jgi:hypothetical protein
MNSVDVELLGEGRLATFELHTDGGECHVLAKLPDGTDVRGAGEDYFEALCDLRATLETRGRRLLCAGARMDVHPSSMARQLVLGRRAYVLGGLPKGEKPPVVDIFDPAEAVDVVSVEVQRDWYKQWLAAPRGQVVYASSS